MHIHLPVVITEELVLMRGNRAVAVLEPEHALMLAANLTRRAFRAIAREEGIEDFDPPRTAEAEGKEADDHVGPAGVAP